MDPGGALDRFRAAQEASRRGALAPSEAIEAAIADSRVRQLQGQLREMQLER